MPCIMGYRMETQPQQYSESHEHAPVLWKELLKEIGAARRKKHTKKIEQAGRGRTRFWNIIHHVYTLFWRTSSHGAASQRGGGGRTGGHVGSVLVLLPGRNQCEVRACELF